MSWQGVRKYLKLEVILGLIVIGGVVVVILPPFSASLEEEQAFRTVSTAENLTRVILDFHTDTGSWPPPGDQGLDLACLTGGTPGMEPRVAQAGAGLNAVADPTGPRPWLKEVPLDAWQRPYHVLVLGAEFTSSTMISSDLDPGKPAPYPKRPKDGVVIVVISAGPNGVLDTQLRPWKPAWLLDYPFFGDDLGYVLAGG